MIIRIQNREKNLNRLNIRAAFVLCMGCVIGAASAADDLDADYGLHFWGAKGNQPQFSAAQGPSLLRPPASWAWNDAAAPQLDLATGVGHRFSSGLSLDAGLSLAHAYEQHSAIDYHDYFLGVSYGSLDGKVWYLPESTLSADPILYYEAGWQRAITGNLSLSLRVGQAQASNYGLLDGRYDQPSLSLGASTDYGGYGLGLRLIDGGGGMFGGEQDLRLMGSISKPLR
jgi:hypothetical protein